MSSTLVNLVGQFKKNETDLKQLALIVDQILSTKHDEQQRIMTGKEMNKIVSKLMNKIDSTKQVSTFKYLSNITLKLAQTYCYCSIQSNIAEEWLATLTQLFQLNSYKSSIAGVIAQTILKNSNLAVKYLRNGDFLLAIINQITNEDIKNHYNQILIAIVQLDHFNQLHFKDSSNDYVLNSSQQQLRKAFQNLLIECLKLLDKTGEQNQSLIYGSFGEKVFSKLTNQLMLSEYLLQKLKKKCSPELQIQVLSCLFILVGKYQLQLQRFYENLQLMLKSDTNLRKSLFRSANSRRLLKLIEAALRSSKVPFKNIISLTHLLLNKIMTEKSQFCFWILSFLVNLVKKHRQLQSHLSEFPEIGCLKHHYSSKIRSLIGELFKNLNKCQYLQINDFSKINCEKLCNNALDQISNKIDTNSQSFQLKVPYIFDHL